MVMIVLLVVCLLFVLLAIRVPVAFSLLISGAVGILLSRDEGVVTGVLANLPYDATAKYSLTVIPMFIFMGLLAMHGGIAEDLFAATHRFLRRVPSALALATILTCAFFAAVSGSSIATAATVGRISIAEMVKYGYDKSYAAGVVAAGGTLGILIPPSIILVLYGIISNQSIGDLLLAGILPGLLSALMYCLGAILLVKLRPKLHQPVYSPTEVRPVDDAKDRNTLGGVARVGILFVIVMGGIYSGVVTVTESAALGAFAALVMLILDLRRRRSELVTGISSALKESASLTSMVFAIVIGAAVLSYFLVSVNVPTIFTNWVTSFDASPTLVLLLILFIFIPLGMFLDPISIVLLSIPLLYPIIEKLGYDGIWFGVIAVKMIEIGLMTPPVGLNVFVVAASTKGLAVASAFRGVMPFVVVDLLTVGILILFPEIVTWLPSLGHH